VTTTIRVSEKTRDRLAALAGSTGQPMTRVLDQAVDALERQVFFDQLNRRFDELRQDPEAWAEIEAERRAEETARGDASR
jgi:predicted transcriptional regulator